MNELQKRNIRFCSFVQVQTCTSSAHGYVPCLRAIHKWAMNSGISRSFQRALNAHTLIYNGHSINENANSSKFEKVIGAWRSVHVDHGGIEGHHCLQDVGRLETREHCSGTVHTMPDVLPRLVLIHVLKEACAVRAVAEAFITILIA